MQGKGDKMHSEKAYFDSNWKPPKIVYGSDLIKLATDTDEKYAVISMDIPWNIVQGGVVKEPEMVAFVPNMHIETMKEIEKQIPDNIDMIMGVGGGSSHDCAKFVALKKNARLVQFPTIFGGDAVVTTAIGIRDKGRVRYIGHVKTDTIYVDFSVLRRAPHKLVRYGAADVLSSYTGLLDWKLASDIGKEKYDSKIARYAKEDLLGKLRKKSDEISNVKDEGIKAIIELFLEYHRISHVIKTDRVQEGAEHFFAYNAEYIAKRTFIHGALLSLGIWVIGGFFYKEKEETEAFLDSLGLEYNLKSAGLSKKEFVENLKTLDEFTKQSGYYYSIVNEIEVTNEMVDSILQLMK